MVPEISKIALIPTMLHTRWAESGHELDLMFHDLRSRWARASLSVAAEAVVPATEIL